MFTIDQKDLPDRLKSYTMLDGTPIPNYIVVDILNAAIEAGIVSPPCWCMRERGKLWTDHASGGKAMLFPVPDPNMAYGPRKTEHWKGQTD